MTNLFSRDLLIKKPRLNRLQISRPTRILQIIPEEDETRSSASSSSSSSPISSSSSSPCPSPSPLHLEPTGKRTFSNSHIEVSFGDEDDKQSDDEFDSLLSTPPRPAPRPPMATSSPIRSGSTSPTPSTSSSSSDLPSTPTSSDDEFHFPTVRFNPRRASIRPLNIIKNNTSGAPATGFESNLSSFLDPLSDDDDDDSDEIRSRIGNDDEDEESDSEWYTREFSKILSLTSPIPPSFPKQHLPSHLQPHQSFQDYAQLLPPRPESLLIEPILAEAIAITATTAPRPSSPPYKRPAVSHTHKRSRSAPKEVPPPVPPIPTHFLPTASAVASMTIPQIIEPPSTPPATKARPRSLSVRRPPPRMSIPDDCMMIEDIVTGGCEDDETSWPSAFDISSYEHPSPALPPAYISTSTSSHLHLFDSFLTPFPPQKVPDSPGSMYSQVSTALPSCLPGDNVSEVLIFAGEELGEIEFGLEDVQFDLSIDTPMRLPLSLPNSPIDLEMDFAFGLQQLRKEVVSPAAANAEAGEDEPQPVQVQPIFERVLPPLPSEPARSLPPTPTTASSFDSFYANFDAEDASDASLSSSSSQRPILRSKWSSSTLASIREEHASSRLRSPIMSTKFAAANKLKLYFGGGRGYKQEKQKQQQSNRSGSAAAIAAAKAAVARAAAGAIYTNAYEPYPSPSVVPSSVKKAQRQVVVLPPPPSSSTYNQHFHPRTPPAPKTPTTPTSPTSLRSAYSISPPASPVGYGKGKARWSRRESDVMVIGYGYNGVGAGGVDAGAIHGGRELRRRGSLTPTVSDAGSEESCSSCSSNGLRRKPIPIEMFLRSGATATVAAAS